MKEMRKNKMIITVTNTYEVSEEMYEIMMNNMNRNNTNIIEELQEWDVTDTEVNITE